MLPDRRMGSGLYMHVRYTLERQNCKTNSDGSAAGMRDFLPRVLRPKAAIVRVVTATLVDPARSALQKMGQANLVHLHIFGDQAELQYFGHFQTLIPAAML